MAAPILNSISVNCLKDQRKRTHTLPISNLTETKQLVSSFPPTFKDYVYLCVCAGTHLPALVKG